MRSILVFTLLAAGICASALPEPSLEPGAPEIPDSRFIEGPVIEGIEAISQAIKDGGFDPFYIKEDNYGLELPVPVIFNAAGFLEEILFTGLSNIVVNHMNFNILLRLNFELELPRLHVSARAARGHVTLFGNTLTAQADGRVDIRETIIRGEVRISLGIISGISISRVTVDFNLGHVISNIRLAIQGLNYSHDINNFISSTIPETLREFDAEVNELIAIILFDVLDEYLDLRKL